MWQKARFTQHTTDITKNIPGMENYPDIFGREIWVTGRPYKQDNLVGTSNGQDRLMLSNVYFENETELRPVNLDSGLELLNEFRKSVSFLTWQQWLKESEPCPA